MAAGVLSAAAGEKPLLVDDFDTDGPLNAKTWEVAGAPRCRRSEVRTGTGVSYGFWSKRRFSRPISVRFRSVRLLQAEAPTTDNHLGITPGFSPDMLSFRFSGGRIYVLRRLRGRVYGQPNRSAGGGWGVYVGMIRRSAADRQESVACDFRIDWWPGRRVRYFINGRKVAEYTDHVMHGPSPVGVRDEMAYYRIGAIEVIRLGAAE